MDLANDNTLFIIGTGTSRDNLRTALWLKQKYPKATVLVGSNKESRFATSVAEEKEITAFIINGLLEDTIQKRWIR